MSAEISIAESEKGFIEFATDEAVPYYYEMSTGRTLWQLPADATRADILYAAYHAEGSGMLYYHNLRTGEVAWAPHSPRENDGMLGGGGGGGGVGGTSADGGMSAAPGTAGAAAGAGGTLTGTALTAGASATIATGLTAGAAVGDGNSLGGLVSLEGGMMPSHGGAGAGAGGPADDYVTAHTDLPSLVPLHPIESQLVPQQPLVVPPVHDKVLGYIPTVPFADRPMTLQGPGKKPERICIHLRLVVVVCHSCFVIPTWNRLLFPSVVE